MFPNQKKYEMRRVLEGFAERKKEHQLSQLRKFYGNLRVR